MSVRPYNNIIDTDKDISNQYEKKKKLKSNQLSSSDQSLLHSLTNNQCFLTIAQHNVVSFHNHTKQLQIIHEVYLNNIDVLELTETNLLPQSIKHQKSYLPKEYVYFFESSTSYKGSGVDLCIKQHIADYVFNHYDNHGRYIVALKSNASLYFLRIKN